MKRKFADHSIAAGGLLAFSIIILQSYLSIKPNDLDIYQKYSLITLAISIPSLSFWFLASKENNKYEFSGTFIFIPLILFFLGIVSSLIAIGLLFFHYSSISGYIFTFIALFATIVLLCNYNTKNEK